MTEPTHVHKVVHSYPLETCGSCGAPSNAWCNVIGHRCPTCFVRDEEASHAPKVVVKRTVEVEVDLPPAVYSYESAAIDLQEGETLAGFIARQRAAGQSVLSTVQDLELLDDLELNFAIREHYEDGTTKCVDAAEWVSP